MGNPRGLKQSLAKGVGKESVRAGSAPAIIGISGKNCFRALSPGTFPLDTFRPARALAMEIDRSKQMQVVKGGKTGLGNLRSLWTRLVVCSLIGMPVILSGQSD